VVTLESVYAIFINMVLGFACTTGQFIDKIIYQLVQLIVFHHLKELGTIDFHYVEQLYYQEQFDLYDVKYEPVSTKVL